MGGGKRKPFSSNKSKVRRPNNHNHNYNQSLFIEGGILADFDLPTSPRISSHRGKGYKSNGSSTGLKFRDSNSRKPNAIPFRYDYPSTDRQETPQSKSFSGEKRIGGDAIGTRPLILLGNKDNKITVYEDSSPSMEASAVAYNYEYTSGFVLGESSHSGLGFSEEPDINVAELSSGLIDEDEGIHRGLGFSDKLETPVSEVVFSSKIVQDGFSSGEIEENVDDGSMEYDDEEDDDGDDSSSPKQNSAYVSIGGVRIYTQDISDSGSEDEEDGSSDEGSDDSGTSESDDSEDYSEFDSAVDSDVMEDYLEGIGGSSKILDSKFLAKNDIGAYQDVDDSDDDSSDKFGDTLKKMSGIALHEASRMYGLPKKKPKKKTSRGPHKSNSNSKDSINWSPREDMMIVKDPRRLSAKKKHVARFPQSWPSDGRKSRRFGRFPGEKKKHRKEMIAVKRRERMISRGVDLEKINLKLKQMVLNNADMLSFHPMHARDCSQVQRLAAIYRLKSVCQNAGKKRFVTVSKTQHTSMPSVIDEVRLQKLIGSSKDDPVVGTPDKNSANRQVGSGVRSSEKRRGVAKRPADYATQPVSFVASGVIQSEETIVVESSNQETKVVASSMNTDSFEVHTKGFGSKMMAKMGYVEGEGLGKDGKGMSKPIEVIQRPKSLGLGMTFQETPSQPVKVVTRHKHSGGGGSGLARRSAGAPTPTIGAFEIHTKGFGSKMMAKMGFVDGMGLGRDSQGISTPLTAVRRPKARGLGAEGKRT